MRGVLISLFATAALAAQTPQSSERSDPAFDVVSIKPNTSGKNEMSVGARAGRFTAVGATPLVLVQNAYPHHTFHILGAPGWMNAARYDVSAVIAPPVTPNREQLQTMMRALLAARFNFAAHTETREMPAYVLTFARPDRSLGRRMQPWDVNCRDVWAGTTSATPSSVPGIPPCGGRAGGGLFAQSGVDMESFVRFLASNLEAAVVDRTGLEGNWEIHLQWNAGPTRFDGASADEFGSLFTSLEEQLGLKLVAQRMPVEVLVIDRIERPSEN